MALAADLAGQRIAGCHRSASPAGRNTAAHGDGAALRRAGHIGHMDIRRRFDSDGIGGRAGYSGRAGLDGHYGDNGERPHGDMRGDGTLCGNALGGIGRHPGHRVRIGYVRQ